jgi:hypothetical protein
MASDPEATTTRMPAVQSARGAIAPITPIPVVPGLSRTGDRCTISHDSLARPCVISPMGNHLGYLVQPRDHDLLVAYKAELAREGDGTGLIAMLAWAFGCVLVVAALLLIGFHYGRGYERAAADAGPRFSLAR